MWLNIPVFSIFRTSGIVWAWHGGEQLHQQKIRWERIHCNIWHLGQCTSGVIFIYKYYNTIQCNIRNLDCLWRKCFLGFLMLQDYWLLSSIVSHFVGLFRSDFTGLQDVLEFWGLTFKDFTVEAYVYLYWFKISEWQWLVVPALAELFRAVVVQPNWHFWREKNGEKSAIKSKKICQDKKYGIHKKA